MAIDTVTVFGPGGFCENCNPEHEHPLGNIIEEYEIEIPEEE
jgi:hypothetical protein